MEIGATKYKRTMKVLCINVLGVSLAQMSAFAQDLEQSQNTALAKSFAPDYFTQFQPNTAQDMVGRIPGFTLKDNSDNARGFGQATLNILINGRRPSAKSQNANDILGRIPSDNVIRIEILDGASLDIPGLSGQVANIVSETGGLSGNWEYSARFEEGTEPQILEGEISINGSWSNLAYVASFESNQFTRTEDGIEQFFEGNGTLFEDRTEDRFLAANRPRASLNLAYTPRDNHIANLNASGSVFNRRNGNRETFQAVSSLGETGQSLSDGGEDEFDYEVGGDYSFPFYKGRLKLIGLHQFENSDFSNSFQLFLDNEDPFQSVFNNLEEEGESIARAEYSWNSSPKHDWQLSWEGAFNFLDSTTEFFSTDDPLEIENVRVEELRTVANLTHSWKFSDAVKIQTSLGAEYSDLDVVTGGDPARQFFRPKGFVSVSYAQSDQYTWRAKVERGVGQLNFGTFVSSVNLTEDLSNSGNADIVPDQFWDAEVELERKDDGFLSGTLKVFARRIEDPIDRILFPDGSEGPGNLDSAFSYGVELNTTWILDRFGAKGLRLTFDGSLRDSTIDDPVTGESRRINETRIWEYDVNLTHDIPNTNWAWDLGVRRFRQSPFFRIDEILDSNADKPFHRFELTHKNILGMKVTANISNFLELEDERERLIFEDDRLGNLTEIQRFSRGRGPRFGLTISDTF